MTDHSASVALPAGFRTDVAGVPALVVGHVHAFPRHPERGAQVAAFEVAEARTRYRSSIGAGDHGEFVAAKKALIEILTGRTLTEDEVAYM